MTSIQIFEQHYPELLSTGFAINSTYQLLFLFQTSAKFDLTEINIHPK